MKEIIPPVSRELIEAELTADRFHRKTNKSDNEIYILTHHDSPNIMREIGRLRELTFRAAGGGVGEEGAARLPVMKENVVRRTSPG